MSRATIGGVVGAVIGYVVTGYNPQGAYWGWVIGSGVGALTDNTKTYGPRLQDAAQQASQDGTPRTYGYGTFPTTGVILWRDERKEVEKEQGKGGPTAVSYQYLWSYAIGVCVGEINNYLIIERNGTIVYDTRSTEELIAVGYTYEEIAKNSMAQAKWLEKARLYTGSDTQMPDPTMQAVKGVNNVPAYRGYAYIVLDKEDVTNDGGAIPQYRFVVAECGSTREGHDGSYETQLLVTGQSKEDGGPVWCGARADGTLSFAGLNPATGADIPGAVADYAEGVWLAAGIDTVRRSTNNRVSFETLAADTGGTPAVEIVGASKGWVLRNTISEFADNYISRAAQPPYSFATYLPTAIGTNGSHVWSLYNAHFFKDQTKNGFYYASSYRNLYRAPAPEGPWTTLHDQFSIVEAGGNPNGDCIIAWHDAVKIGDKTYFAVSFEFNEAFRRHQIRWSDDGGVTMPDANIVYDGIRANGDPTPTQLVNLGGSVVAYYVEYTGGEGSGVISQSDGFSTPVLTGLAGGGPGRKIACPVAHAYIIGFGPDDGDKCVMFDGSSMSAPATMPIRAAVSICASDGTPASTYYPVPDSPGSYVGPGGQVVAPIGTETDRCHPSLSSIVADQAARRDVTRVIVGELSTTYVDGFRVSTQTNPAANIRALQGAYMFDASEIDGNMHFLMRPQPLTFHLTMDDLTETDGDPFVWEITKENDLLRKVTVNYFDPLTNYNQTAQDWERRSSTIEAKGEGAFEMAITGTGDWAKRLAEKSGKIAWAEARETQLPVTIAQAARYTGEWGTFTDSKAVRHVIRITKIEDQGIRRTLHVRKTRASAYFSSAVGVRSPLPSFPTSNVRGPNVSAILNMPAMRVEDDRAGVYWACTGLLSTWRGATLSLSRDGTTFETGPNVTQSATMGWLLAPLPTASRYGMDTLNTLSVELHPGNPATLESTDYDGIQDERNVIVVQYPSGKVEVMQFMTATPTGERRYELTGLMRGRKDTTPGDHEPGAVFVLMDNNVRFVALRADDVGKTLTFRSTSTGTDPDAADEDTITMTTIESLREWQPYNIVVTPDGLGGYCIAWTGRARLGTDRVPIDSQYADGYRVTFTIGSVVHEIDTDAQAICVSAAKMLEVFGPSYGIPTITVRARSRVATNDDDFDSPPGGPATDPFPSYPATIIGGPGDMYEGEGVLDYLGPANNPPFQAYGGKLEEFFTGYIARNVTCQSSAPGSGIMVGIPLTAETENADTTLWPSGPDVIGGPFTITDSVTALPMPAFAMMNELAPWGDKKLVTLATSPPRSTKRIGSSGLGGLRSRAGFSTGQRRCEFTIANIPAGGRVAVGVLASGVDSHLAPGTGGTFAHIVTANGTFAVEVDAVTGAVEVFELGVGLVASGTLPLTYAHDGKYRFAWVVNDAQHPAAGATVHTNQGNESWAITPTGTFGGVPNEAHVIPCGFDAEVGAANGYWPQGTQSLTLASAGGFSGTSVIYAYSEFAKSAGAWRIGMVVGLAGRIGLCKAGHTGLLGQGGDSFGMSYDFSVIGSPMIVFDTTWAGQIRIPHPFYTMDRKIIFVCDFDAHTVEVWGKPQFSDYILLSVLTGLPSGAWVPAGNHAVELTNGASEVSGATDWSLTKTP